MSHPNLRVEQDADCVAFNILRIAYSELAAELRCARPELADRVFGRLERRVEETLARLNSLRAGPEGFDPIALNAGAMLLATLDSAHTKPNLSLAA